MLAPARVYAPAGISSRRGGVRGTCAAGRLMQARRDARGGGRDQPSAGEAARTTRSPLTVSRSKESEGDYRVGDPADASAREVIERGGALRLPGRTEVHLSISVGRHGYLLTGTDGAITIAYVVVYFALHLLYINMYSRCRGGQPSLRGRAPIIYCYS